MSCLHNSRGFRRMLSDFHFCNSSQAIPNEGKFWIWVTKLTDWLKHTCPFFNQLEANKSDFQSPHASFRIHGRFLYLWKSRLVGLALVSVQVHNPLISVVTNFSGPHFGIVESIAYGKAPRPVTWSSALWRHRLLFAAPVVLFQARTSGFCWTLLHLREALS